MTVQVIQDRGFTWVKNRGRGRGADREVVEDGVGTFKGRTSGTKWEWLVGLDRDESGTCTEGDSTPDAPVRVRTDVGEEGGEW